MAEVRFLLTKKDPEMVTLLEKASHTIRAIWAKGCAERVLPYFEEKFPKDDRPLKALETLQMWIDTGKFSMAVIRKASLDSHAAARAVGDDTEARSAARACGQAVATAHVATHAYGAAIYAQQAIFRVTNSMEEVTKERDWQYKYLQELLASS